MEEEGYLCSLPQGVEKIMARKRKKNPYTPEEFHEIAKGMGFTVPELEGEMIHRRNKLIEFVDQGGGDMVFYRQEMHKIARFNSLLKQLGYAKKFPANTPDRWKREDKRMDSSAFYDSKVPWRRKNTNKGIPIDEWMASPEYAAEMEDWRKEVQRRKGVGRQIAALTSGPKELREILGMMRDDEGSLDPKQEWTTNFKVYQGYRGHEIESDKFVGTKHQLAKRLADRPNEEDEIESITDSQGNEYTFHCEDPTLLSDTETGARWNPNPARHRRRNPTKRKNGAFDLWNMPEGRWEEILLAIVHDKPLSIPFPKPSRWTREQRAAIHANLVRFKKHLRRQLGTLEDPISHEYDPDTHERLPFFMLLQRAIEVTGHKWPAGGSRGAGSLPGMPFGPLGPVRRNPTKRRSRRNPYAQADRVTNYSTLKRGDLIVATALQPGSSGDAIYLVLGNTAGKLRLYNVKVQEYLANDGDIPANVDTCFTLSPTPKNLIYHRAGASLDENSITQLVSTSLATQGRGRLMLVVTCNLLIPDYLNIPTSFDD